MCEDIIYVIMMYFYFDYVLGLIKCINGYFFFVFLNVKIFVSEIEWNEMRNFNICFKNMYWK